MKTKFLIILIILIIPVFVSAAIEDVRYPIEELGNCKSKSDCAQFCDKSDNTEACMNFARKNKIMSEQEIKIAEKFLSGEIDGPGGCSAKDECDAYCDNIKNIDECVSFAEKNSLLPPEELAEAKKVQIAIARGIKPPSCGNKKACDAYCASEEHFQECIDFSIAAGMMSEEEAQMAKKTGGKGPGGCKGKEECEAFCNNPDNQEACFDFGRDNGLIPEEDLKRVEEGKQQMKQSLEQAPSKLLECLKTELGVDMVEKIKNGFMPPQNIGEKMRICFEKMGPDEGGMMPPGQAGPGEISPGGQSITPQAGPGGCKTPEECKFYCETNQEECKNFYPAGDENNKGSGPEVQQRGQIFEPGTQQAPLAPPSEQQIPPQPQQPPQGQQPPSDENSPPPPVSIINTDSFIGSLLYAAFKILASY